MLSKSILTAIAVAMLAGLGLASAEEQFITMEGIDAQALDSSELAAITGAEWFYFNRQRGVFSRIAREGDPNILDGFEHGIVCFAGGAPIAIGTGSSHTNPC